MNEFREQWRERWAEFWYELDLKGQLRETGHALVGLVSPWRWWSAIREAWYWWGFPTTAAEWSPKPLFGEWRRRWEERKAERQRAQAAQGRRRSVPLLLPGILFAAFLAWLVFAIPTRTDSRLRDAERALARGKSKTSGQPADRAARIHTSLGMSYLEKSRLAEAADEFRSALEWDASNPTARLGMARVAAELKDQQIALGHAQKAAADNPADPAALTALGVAQAEGNKPKEAAATFEKALEAGADPASTYVSLAALAARGKDWKKAERYARDATEANPRDAAAHLMLASILLQRKRLPEVEEELETALSIAPKEYLTHQVLARVRIMQKRYSEGLDALRKVQKLKPDYPLAFLDAGIVSLRMQDPDGAEQEFQKAVTISPNSAAAWLGLAEAAEQRGQIDDAIGHYEKVLGIHPTLMVAMNNLAYHYADTGRQLDRAAELALRVTGAQPLNDSAWDTLGYVQLRRARPCEAVAAMRAAVKLRPKKAVYRFRLARALAASGDASQAAEEAQAALKAGLKEPEASEARTLVAPTGSTP